MKPNKTGAFVGSKITGIMKQQILQAVTQGSYISVSDFVRNAVKEKLQRESGNWIQMSSDY